MLLLATAHLDQPHERHHALIILDSPRPRSVSNARTWVSSTRAVSGRPSREPKPPERPAHTRPTTLGNASRHRRGPRGGSWGPNGGGPPLGLSELLEERQLGVDYALDQRAHVSTRVYCGEVGQAIFVNLPSLARD